MIREIVYNDGGYGFILVKVDAYENLDRVCKIFENHFIPSQKQYISGWHSVVIEYVMENITITIGNLYDAISIMLISPENDQAKTRIKEVAEFIDDELNST